MARTTRTTRIHTSQGIRLAQGSYTATDLATWVVWAYRVALHVHTDAELLADAEARIARLEAGQVWDIDVSGLQDWAEEMGW